MLLPSLPPPPPSHKRGTGSQERKEERGKRREEREKKENRPLTLLSQKWESFFLLLQQSVLLLLADQCCQNLTIKKEGCLSVGAKIIHILHWQMFFFLPFLRPNCAVLRRSTPSGNPALLPCSVPLHRVPFPPPPSASPLSPLMVVAPVNH